MFRSASTSFLPVFSRRLLPVCLALAAPLAGAAQTLRWTYSGPSNSEFFSSPAVTADGFFIVGTSGGLPLTDTNRVICFRRTIANTFSVRWWIALPDFVDSSPALSGDGLTAYVGCWDGRLYALNVTTTIAAQRIRWSYQTGGYIASSPAVAADGTIYVASADGLLYALNASGTLKWVYTVGSEMESSPAIAPDGAVVVGTLDGRVVGIRADGTLKWEFWAELLPDTDSRIRSSPAIGPDGTIYVGSGNGRLYAIDFTGQLKWGLATPEPVDTCPAISADGTIYFGNRLGYLTAVDAEGFELWSAFLGDIFYSSPVLDAKGNVYIVAFAGNSTSALHSRSPDGIVRFAAVPLPAVIDASPTIVDIGLVPTLVVGGYNGQIYGVQVLDSVGSDPWAKFRRNLAQDARTDTGLAPVISVPPNSKVAPVDSLLELRTLAESESVVAYQWRRHGQPLAGQTEPYLTLASLAAADVGGYDCLVSNPFGEVVSPTAWVVATEPPTVTDQLLSWRFHRPIAAGSPAVMVEGSGDLRTWFAASSEFEATVEPAAVETRRATASPFLRLRLVP